MASTINASNTTGGVITTGDGSGILQLQSGGVSTLTVNGSSIGIGTASPSYTLEVVGDIRAASGGDLRLASATGTTTSGGDSALYNDANNLIITTGTTATERMRIDSSGNVGIGTTSPASKMEIRTTSGGSVFNALTLSNYVGASVGTGVALYFDPNGAGSLARAASIQSVQATSGNFADMRFYTANSDTPAERMRITPSGDVGVGQTSPGAKLDVSGNIRLSAASPNIEFNNGGGMVYGPAANTLAFATGGTPSSPVERARINSDGKLLIGTTTITSASVTGLLQVQSEVFSKGSSAGLFFENRSGGVTSNTNWYGWYNTGGTTYFYNGSANIASINSSTGAYTALSDRNKKKDIAPSTLGLEAIMGLQPTEYRMKDDAPDAPKQLGFIAQEVRDHIPQAYVETEDFIGLNDRAIIAALVKAVQEQQTQIAALEARLAQLEGK